MGDLLFEPVNINVLEIKNRINMPAMHMNMCDDYQVTDRLLEFYGERARGGVGMITVGQATVDEFSGGGPLCLGAHRDEFIPGLSRLADVIKENGARAFVQLNHGGRYAMSRHIGNRQAVAPSSVTSRLTRELPRELTADEICQIISRFAQAAFRVKTAGFDGVEVLCGTGYLVSEFFSPLTNLRSDEYGGSLVNRMRFGVDVIKAIRQAVGKDFPIVVRMNGNDFMPDGNSKEDFREFAKALVAESVDALNINVGWHETRVPVIVSAVPRGIFGYLSQGMKEVVDVPVMVGHRINDPQTARNLISEKMCDMVCMGRSLIADPNLPRKVKEAREKEIIHCIACGQGCFDNLFKEKAIQCICNPKVGHEKKYRQQLAAVPRKVLVVGGGAAGLSAALAAAECGHKVTLYEKSTRLGGQLYLAGAPPGRDEFIKLANDLANNVIARGIQLKTGTKVDVRIIEMETPDEVILATGAVPLTPPIAGVTLPNVVQAWDVLLNKVSVGKRVVVIGGGAVGVETALFVAEQGTLSGDALKFLFTNQAEDPDVLYKLATRGTKEIVLIEMLPAIGKDIGMSTRWTMMQDISRAGVSMLKDTKALEITSTGVKIESDGQVTELPADTVVLAGGAKPYNPLQEILEQRAIPYQVVGDAFKIGLVSDAVHQGFACGKRISVAE
ncbi:FAD-dependent oxidoreductase [Desulforhopalus singaporensis]|uniref:2,4-dienoyl-CoA reductase (NADPH2) n=1 Tax=Desulforhopalus singaporensis TaxID=91360 RepID=A0A1H0V1K2_9BACT|nr:FAD-dependent oxidoreductase [Desulforhopalus singaporensis]SDP72224.1 2,4-dienoyl-CoA reductase (NADPH2) [Desulforhopalus singaporensis]